MPAPRLRLSRDSERLAMLEQMVCYLNLQTLTEFLQIFQIGGVGPLLLPQIYFCPSSFLLLSCTFLNVRFSFILTLWIPYIPPIFNIYYPNACI